MKPKVELVEHPNYRTINVSGVIGGHRPMFFEAVLFSNELKVTEALTDAELNPERSHIKRTIECRLVMDPFEAKIMATWLNSEIATYEKNYGRIPSPEEVNSKLGGPEDSLR
jgi:hypothetical protein